LAQILRRPPQAINEIVRGNKEITPETALELAEALGTSPELWANLEANYRLSLARQSREEKDIARWSRLYDLVPVAELTKRGWIKADTSLDQLERQICAFLGIASPDETPTVAVSFRRGQGHGPEWSAQVAWVKRVEQLARKQSVTVFDRAQLKKALPELLAFAACADDTALVPAWLAKYGVRFVVVEQLPHTYIDGAAFCLDIGPVVALTLRYDRIDAFWFTLLHELAHVLAPRHIGHLDQLYGDGITESEDMQEQAANRLARQWLVDQEVYVQFARSLTPPFVSRRDIERFALSQNRHSGIILGQLQHDELVSYKNLRAWLVKVSPYLGAG
jgi:HTH-type transcriptional regulator / antitoxin HigA